MTKEERNNPNSKKAQKVIELNKKILSEYLDKSNDKETEIIKILQNLIDNNFDFGILTNNEKTLLAQTSIMQSLNESNLFADLK
jgi:predicted transcriptional regulator